MHLLRLLKQYWLGIICLSKILLNFPTQISIVYFKWLTKVSLGICSFLIIFLWHHWWFHIRNVKLIISLKTVASDYAWSQWTNKPRSLFNTEVGWCTLHVRMRALFRKWTSLQMHSLFWEWNPIRDPHRRGHIHRGTNCSWGLGLERGGTTQCFISGSMFCLPSRLYFR